MSEQDHSIFARIWHGFWRFVDGARRLTLNILFLLLLIVVFRLLTADSAISGLQNSTSLVIQPVGAIVEQYSGYPLDRALARLTGDERPETQLRDILAALDYAAADAQITQVVLDTSRIEYLGMANLQELGQALERFRASGKRVVAMDSFYTEDRYYLASLADEIWLHPQGMIWFDGFAYYRNYFKEALDKLAVEVNLFRVGEYKSAAEPFIRDSMSEADRQAGRYLIDEMWTQYLDAIALQRGLPVEVLNNLTQTYANEVIERRGDTAQLALELGLVDRLITPPEARADLAQKSAVDQQFGYRQISMLDYLAQKRLTRLQESPQVAVVVAEGAIVGGEQPPGMVGAETVASLLRTAGRDDDVKAIVLRINSPGGDALASEVIRNEMTLIREAGKPVVVSMGNLAASGGYWIAMGADEIWANASTITGSIGIFAMIPNFHGTLDKIGIHSDGVGTTPLAAGIRPDRPMDENVKIMVQSMIDHGYEEFLALVANHRQMSPTAVNEVAQGRVWTGTQALDRQLVDQTGTLLDAIDAAARRAGLTDDDYQVRYVEQPISSMERWVLDTTATALVELELEAPKRSPLSQLFSGGQPLVTLLKHPQVRALWQQLQLLAASDPEHPVMLAHCLCASP
ncbi:MAG: signal peptide peptidase SppA [Wenzhouxiangellaceae bacterium]